METSVSLEQAQTQRFELSAWQLLERCPAPAMNPVKRNVEKVAKVNTSVVIYGETGVGKEIVAGAIHQLSPRGERPFEILDCTNVNQNLMGSEVFGHEHGSFTGSIGRHIGQFESANESTILLDEIGELPMDLQCRILRALESRSFRRVGGNEQIHSNFRLIVSTNRDLKVMVSEKKFREDLFYRLNAFPITVPPLRLRPLDIMHLAKFFVQGLLNGGKTGISFSPESEQWLLKQPWPGNVRQLRNAVERATVLVNGGAVIQPHHLDESIVETGSADNEPNPLSVIAGDLMARIAELTDQVRWSNLKDEIERAVIKHALSKNQTIQEMARGLGLDHVTFLRKRRKYGLLDKKE